MNISNTGAWWFGVSLSLILGFLALQINPVMAETLDVSINAKVHSLEQKELIRHPALVEIGPMTLPIYPNQTLLLKGIPLCKLFEGLIQNPENYLKVTARDGYVAYFTIKDFYPCASNKIPGFLVLEDPQYPWPLLLNSDRSAGPFYLVWLGKRFSESVYGIQSLEVVAEHPLQAILPAGMNAKEHAGARVFMAKCNVCHLLNGSGGSKLAHDLNNPNPLNYFSEDELRRFIRDPHSLRPVISPKKFPFPPSKLSQQELTELISFLKFIKNNTAANQSVP